jgi:hypothetical protein
VCVKDAPWPIFPPLAKPDHTSTAKPGVCSRSPSWACFRGALVVCGLEDKGLWALSASIEDGKPQRRRGDHLCPILARSGPRRTISAPGGGKTALVTLAIAPRALLEAPDGI